MVRQFREVTTGSAAMTAKFVAAVMAGGGVGATTRYLLAESLAPPTPPSFPWVTFLINLTGSFALGAVMTLLATAWLSTEYVKPFVATGVIGSFTTWSHFIVESNQLIEAGQARLAILYVVVSIVLGIAVAAGGAALVEARLRRREERTP
jgi:CrcB protein